MAKKHRRRNENRNFQRRQPKHQTVCFLGQTFIVLKKTGHDKQRRYHLMGAPDTPLEGVQFKNVSHSALKKYAVDPKAQEELFGEE